MSQNTKKRFVGVYSELSVNSGHPTFYYRDKSGNTIEVSSVYDSSEQAKALCGWVDMKIVSTTLVDFVKPGRSRNELRTFKR